MIRLLLILLFGVNALNSAKAAEKDEQGLMMIADKHEQQLRTSAARIKDSRLEELVREIACKVAAKDCPKLRVYVLRAPGLNAYMMPNGAMFLHTGLLLRITSDSELASVIGHEIVHYTEAHSLSAMRSRRQTQKVVSLLSLPANIAGVPLAGVPISLIGAAYVTSYSRSAEKESDIKSVRLVHDAGYNPDAAVNLWENYIDENQASNSKSITIFSTHPMVSERLDYLKDYVGNKFLNSNPEKIVQNTLIVDYLEKSRIDLLNEEMRSMKPEQFDVLLSNQSKFSKLSPGVLNYLCASAWVHFTKTKDISGKALENAQKRANFCFEKGAASERGMPAVAYREWAKLNEKLDNKCTAKNGYETYLDLKPDSWDAKFITKKLNKLKCSQG